MGDSGVILDIFVYPLPSPYARNRSGHGLSLGEGRALRANPGQVASLNWLWFALLLVPLLRLRSSTGSPRCGDG